ncbi:hypothetical protein FGG08_005344 [Glutinoglossum americanum]|uniref:protein S-acyltransferase n=1 Tax=Glutinoglossum americanum TaxID=1670608 RepID=A0A9P8I3F6_9PEZI|nr:hypothetical protein FGG08_005344 [Glutinoglossum americanum]
MDACNVGVKLPTEADVRLEGLTVLADPPSAAIDVVFVHGFTGHPRRTWTYFGEVSQDNGTTHNNDSRERPSKFRRLIGSDSKRAVANKTVFWPQDLLPTTLTNARVLTYGYDSNIRHRLGAPASKSTVYDLGHNLLLSLEARRSSQPSRPLIFVAHSLGGIIVKEALRRSEGQQAHHSHLYSIYDATIALICFGTPHSGADPRGVVYRAAETVVRLAGFVVNDQLVNSLLPSSERLRELRDEFSRMSRSKNWMLYSFQEQYGLKFLNGDKVVEDTSSAFGDSTIEITQHIAGNHMDMCRFKGLDDGEYEKVTAAFRRISQVIEDNAGQLGLCSEMSPSSVEQPKFTAAATEEQKKACLDSLSFQQIDARLMNIKKAHERTCNWLFEQLEYQKWLNRDLIYEHHGFLWIKGKPGAGKSTMMKHALLKTKKASRGATIISFFFNARGSILEKSTLGMYRSLLFQLLTALPALQDLFVPIFLMKPNHNDIYGWNAEELQEFFITAIEDLQQHRLVCFIDALDECEENEVRKMVEFLESLAEAALSSGTSLNICLSSRHYPHISIQNGIQLDIDRQGGHDNDISTYVQSKFKAPASKQMDDIKAEILSRASGVFLWVVLVVQMLNKAYDHGQIHTLRRRLNEIPDELDELFADILMRDVETRDESILCLQWLLFTQRPLKREELYFAVLSGTEPTALGQWNPAEVSHETIDRFILSCSKGLAEVSKDQTVQFIHETVRDFFLLRNGLAQLQPDLTANMTGLSQEQLKRCCYQYIITDMFKDFFNDALPCANSQAAKDLRKIASEAFPFLEYAVNNIFIHADAAQSWGISQKELLREFEPPNSKMHKWANLNSIFQRYDIRRYTPEVKVLYILSEKNLLNLVRVLLDGEADIDATGERYGSAIQAAAVNGHERIVQILIGAGANVNVAGGEHCHPLIAAAIKGHDKVVQVLLEGEAIIAQDVLDSYLSIFTKLENEVIVQLLLERGADPDSKDPAGKKALRWAVRNGHETIVRLLLANPKVDPDSKDTTGRTPLWWTIRNDVITRMLLEKGANPNCAGPGGQTLLCCAASAGLESRVRTLLENGADPNSLGAGGQTPLWCAAYGGHESIARLLLENGVDPNFAATVRRTPLWQATSNGHEFIVRLLLKSGADPNPERLYRESPLTEAASKGHEAIVRLLLENGAILHSKDYNGRAPLSEAARNGHEAIVRLLLENGANLDFRGDDGRTPLSQAARNGHEAIVRLLLENGASLNSKDGSGRTSLSQAARNGHESVVRLLEEQQRKHIE